MVCEMECEMVCELMDLIMYVMCVLCDGYMVVVLVVWCSIHNLIAWLYDCASCLLFGIIYTRVAAGIFAECINCLQDANDRLVDMLFQIYLELLYIFTRMESHAFRFKYSFKSSTTNNTSWFYIAEAVTRSRSVVCLGGSSRYVFKAFAPDAILLALYWNIIITERTANSSLHLHLITNICYYIFKSMI